MATIKRIKPTKMVKKAVSKTVFITISIPEKVKKQIATMHKKAEKTAKENGEKLSFSKFVRSLILAGL